MAPEPRDKLDAMTRRHRRVGRAAVNGPEDVLPTGTPIDWRPVEDDVRRLRQRIFTASQAGDLKRVRNLQKLMLRSRANALVSVRRVTEVNAGRKTAGVDGQVVLLTSQDKADLADWVQQRSRAVDARAGQAGVHPEEGRETAPARDSRDRRPGAAGAWSVNALEPEWEARFEPRSYGFRPGRGCHDAIEAIYVTATGATCQAAVGAGRGPGGGVRPDRP